MAERGGNISCKIDNHEIFAEFEYGKISVESTNNEENGSDASVFEINAEEGHSFYMDFINGGTGVIVICANVAAGSEDHTFYKSDDYGVTWNKLDIEEPSYKMIRSIELLNESEMKLGYNSVEGNGEIDYFDLGIPDEPVDNSDYSITAENEKYNIADIMKKANSLLEEKSVSYISKNTIKKTENGVISYVENDCTWGEADKGKTHEIFLRKMLINHVFEDSRPELKEIFFWNGQYYREDINENEDVCFVAERKIYDSVSETETKDESEAAKEWDISYYEEDTTCGTEIFMFDDEEISDYSAFNVTETDDSIILYGNVKGNHFSRNRFDSYMELVFSKDDYSILEIKMKYQIDEETSVDHTIHFICYSDESLVDIGQDLKEAAKECR